MQQSEAELCWLSSTCWLSPGHPDLSLVCPNHLAEQVKNKQTRGNAVSEKQPQLDNDSRCITCCKPEIVGNITEVLFVLGSSREG